jgi:hypothetical protein
MGHWKKIIVSGSIAELSTISASSTYFGAGGVDVTTINGGILTSKAINVDTNATVTGSLTVTGNIIGTATTSSTIRVTGSSTSANFPIAFVSQTASNGLPLFADDNLLFNPNTNQIAVRTGSIVVDNTTINSGFITLGGVAEMRMTGSISSSISSSSDLIFKAGPGTNTRLRISASGQMALGNTPFSTNILLSMTAVPTQLYSAAPGNTSVVGFYNNLSWSGSTGGTANVLNYASYARTALGSILSNFWNFRVEENQFFGSSSNVYGYYSGPLTKGTTANYAFWGNVNSSSIGAQNYNIFMQGDAPNYLRGTLFVGNISGSIAPREMIYIRPTGSLIANALRVQNSASLDLFAIGGGASGANTITFHSNLSLVIFSGSAGFASSTTASFQGVTNFATSSTAPTTGIEGDFRIAQNGANYFIYAYIGGRWRSSSLA